MAAKKYLVISDLRGGRNGFDAPLSLPENQCVEALNVDFHEGMLGHKRHGSSAFSDMTATAGTPRGYLSSLFRGSHYTYGDELFFVDSSTPPLMAHRGAIWTSPWMTIYFGDSIAANPEAIHAVTFNNRTYIAFNSGLDRLHYWTYDDNHTRDSIYRVGLPTPGTPTVVDTRVWPYTTFNNYYKIAWITKYGDTIDNRSECSPVVSILTTTTTYTRLITIPAVPSGENITHWELYQSNDGDIYHLVATTAIATTTYTDTSYALITTGDADPVSGANTPPVSWKYLATDGNRLIGGGQWGTSAVQSRVWFTPVLGASDVGDAERVPPANYIDLDAYDGDVITGVVGSFMGNVVVFKSRAIWRLVPTGEGDAPYRAVCLTKAVGCVAPKSICQGDDENGSPALYFMSRRGPYRLGSSGLQYIGRDIEDVIATMNARATVVSHAVWHPDKHQMWFWVALGSDSYPSVILVLDTALARSTTGGCRGGWVKYTGPIATARCSIGWNGSDLAYGSYVNPVPYAGSAATSVLLLKGDQSGVLNDNGTAYQGYVKTKPYALAGLGMNCGVGQSHLTAKAAANVTITQTLDRDYGAETRLSTCSLAPVEQEARVQRQFEGSDMAGAGVVQFQLGDEAASSQAWTLDALMVPYTTHEER